MEEWFNTQQGNLFRFRGWEKGTSGGVRCNECTKVGSKWSYNTNAKTSEPSFLKLRTRTSTLQNVCRSLRLYCIWTMVIESTASYLKITTRIGAHDIPKVRYVIILKR